MGQDSVACEVATAECDAVGALRLGIAQAASTATKRQRVSTQATGRQREARAGGGGVAAAPNLDTSVLSQPVVVTRYRQAPLYSSVKMKLGRYRRAVASELAKLDGVYKRKGAQRRSWRHKAFDLEHCGGTVRVLACDGCDTPEASTACVECGCELRCCPTCARRLSEIRAMRLEQSWEKGEKPREMGLYLLTFTLRYDPRSESDLSVEGLRKRGDTVRDGVRYVWRRYLKGRGRAMAVTVEVGEHGAVHAHALYHGQRPDIEQVRLLYMHRVGDSPMVNVQYVKEPKKAIREVAKYVTKASSPKRAELLGDEIGGTFLDPELAAKVEVAFAGQRLFQCYGPWREAEREDDVPEGQDEGKPLCCAECGLVDSWHPTRFELKRWKEVAGPGWRPRFCSRDTPLEHWRLGKRKKGVAGASEPDGQRGEKSR